MVDVASGVRLRDDALRVDDHSVLLRDVVPMVHERPAEPVGLAPVVDAQTLVLEQEDVLPTLEVVADVLPVHERVPRVIRCVAEEVGVAIVSTFHVFITYYGFVSRSKEGGSFLAAK